MEERLHYVYRHYKKGTNEVFYVGIGRQKDFFRAYDIHSRNIFWNRVVSKYGFYVDIVSKNLTEDTAKELEILLIQSYGRRDLGTGTLTNLTDGGEGTLNVLKTPEQIDKWRESNRGKQDGDKNCMFGRTYDKHHKARKVLNFKTGEVFGCVKEVAEKFGFVYSSLKNALRIPESNSTDFIYLDDNNEDFIYRLRKEPKPLIKNIYTGELFFSLAEAAKANKLSESKLSHQLIHSKINKIGIYYIQELELGTKRNPDNYRPYVCKNKQTGDIYFSIDEAHKKTGLGKGFMLRMLILNNPKSVLDYIFCDEIPNTFTPTKGSKKILGINGYTNLTDEDIIKIRLDVKNQVKLQDSYACFKHKISLSAFQKIRHNITWKHIEI